jgi:hypothetical protein
MEIDPIKKMCSTNKTGKGLHDGQEGKKKRERARKEKEDEERGAKERQRAEGGCSGRGINSVRSSKFTLYDVLGRKKLAP